MDDGVPIRKRDFLRIPTGTVDIDLIRDEANEAAQRSGPRVDVHPMGANLADTVEQAQGDYHST